MLSFENSGKSRPATKDKKMSEPPSIYTGSLNFELPIDLKCTIADCVTRFARLDTLIIELLWIAEMADFEKRKRLAKLHSSELRKKLKNLLAVNAEIDVERSLASLERLTEERNLIAHGSWTINAEGMPIVIWHSKFLEHEDYVGAEQYPDFRFEWFLSTVNHLLEVFSELRRLFEEASQKLHL